MPTLDWLNRAEVLHCVLDSVSEHGNTSSTLTLTEEGGA